MTHHLKPLVSKLSALDLSKPPAPWCKAPTVLIGGLRSIGFQRDSDLLLVVSEQGRGVIDCVTGITLTRDRSEYYEDEILLEAEGIGQMSGQSIRISGLYGGGLPNSTSDNWSLETVTLAWPEQSLLLVEPGSWLYGSLYGKPCNFYKIFSDSEIRAQGFSPTGRTLVIATTSEIYIYSRNTVG
ncbi:MAG: hypothetical protein OEM02_06965 [Desulfobulbaceae bacterium]|nr:hypothetical protein [Desulfobulbaceae bacterium]